MRFATFVLTFHDVVFTHPHEGLHSPIPFGFLTIFWGAAINLG